MQHPTPDRSTLARRVPGASGIVDGPPVSPGRPAWDDATRALPFPVADRPDLVAVARERTGADDTTRVLPVIGPRVPADPAGPVMNVRSELIALYAHLCEAEEAIRAECAEFYPGVSPYATTGNVRAALLDVLVARANIAAALAMTKP